MIYRVLPVALFFLASVLVIKLFVIMLLGLWETYPGVRLLERISPLKGRWLWVFLFAVLSASACLLFFWALASTPVWIPTDGPLHSNQLRG
jgi:hypothetical protein